MQAEVIPNQIFIPMNQYKVKVFGSNRSCRICEKKLSIYNPNRRICFACTLQSARKEDIKSHGERTEYYKEYYLIKKARALKNRVSI